jgi:endonuclease-3 related protein
MKEPIVTVYRCLLDAYGRQHWWPGQNPFEVIIGAILTQAVAWANVERAIASLKEADLMTFDRLYGAPLNKLAEKIRPCLYYNEKAKKLKAFLRFLAEHYEGDLSLLLGLPVPSLRKELLSVRGIGEETADAIILYAAGKPSFVVDAYTRRILSRLGLIEERAAYEEIRTLFMTHLPNDADLYNEYHALLVRHAKERCRSREPICDGCPLREKCRYIASEGEGI